MHITLIGSTEVTIRDHFLTDAFTHPFIEYEVLTEELVFKPFTSYLVLIVDDPSFEVTYIRESIVLEPCTRLLTPNASRTVECDLLILMHLQ